MSNPAEISRRSLLRQAAAVTAAAAAGPLARAQAQQAAGEKERGVNVTGKGLTGGHNLQEGNPTQVLAELQAFLK